MAKNTVKNFAMFTGGADLGSATVSSNVSNVLNQDNIGIVATWTGTSPLGVLAIQVSNDYNPDTAAGNWISLDFGSAIAISGNTGSHNVTINQLPYTYLKALYTKTSGTGTLNCSITTKQVGGS